MKDKEQIEVRRLKERVGGFHKYVDTANLNKPDPTSTFFVNGILNIKENSNNYLYRG